MDKLKKDIGADSANLDYRMSENIQDIWLHKLHKNHHEKHGKLEKHKQEKKSIFQRVSLLPLLCVIAIIPLIYLDNAKKATNLQNHSKR